MYTLLSGRAQDAIWIRPNWPSHTVQGLFSFRLSGASTEPYTSLNVGLHVGDDRDTVLLNREQCATALKTHLGSWVVAEQVHGNSVAKVEACHAGSGAQDTESSIRGVDALVTDVSDLTLVVMAADCVPILFFDEVRKVIAVAHSGWKGTVGHIARNVVETMVREYGSSPMDIHAWLGPSIRQCCYEVNDVVANPVRAEFGNQVMIQRFRKADKYLLSLQACIKTDLRVAGLPDEQIADVGLCTSCQSNLLFSHRADSGCTGRQLAAIRLS